MQKTKSVPIDTRLRRTSRSVKSAIAAVNSPEIDIICGYEKNVNNPKLHNNAQQSIKSLKSKSMIKANFLIKRNKSTHPTVEVYNQLKIKNTNIFHLNWFIILLMS
jgi:hypothetical protein